jgi:hypothetical protein
MDQAYLQENITPIELAMLIIRFVEDNEVYQILEEDISNLKINTDADPGIINAQIKNDIDKSIMGEENIRSLTDRENPRIPGSGTTPRLRPVPSSTVDRNCMFRFLSTSKLENLRGLDICDLVTLLLDQDVNGISYFLAHVVSFLDMNQQKYFQLLNALYELKPYPE